MTEVSDDVLVDTFTPEEQIKIDEKWDEYEAKLIRIVFSDFFEENE